MECILQGRDRPPCRSTSATTSYQVCRKWGSRATYPTRYADLRLKFGAIHHEFLEKYKTLSCINGDIFWNF
ncbi:hypothetical protein BDZ91DRAFT_719960 [Kalaharituber pfeilii]|nr:hypothetical protein BDZ91DRAFT_719960 [Kalaharituber pfeilii]